jgi:hypothetical protein
MSFSSRFLRTDVPSSQHRPNCSSRGKKVYPAGKAGPLGARQLEGFPSRRLDPPRLLSMRPQRLATRRTPGVLLLRLLAPLLGLTPLHQVMDHLDSQLVDAFIHRRFDLGPRRFGVLFAPLRHPQHVA